MLSQASLSSSLDRLYEGPARVCRLQGFRRSYRAGCPNDGFAIKNYAGGLRFPERLLYLDIEESPGMNLPGVLYAVTHEDLFRLDRREVGYERLEVGDRLLEVETDAPVVTYVACEECRVDHPRQGQDIVPASYQSLVDEAATAIGEIFAGDLDRATRSIPPTILADALPVPWIRRRPTSP